MRLHRRRGVLALLGLAAGIGAALPIYAAAGPDMRFAPDLRADPAERIQGPAVYVTGSGRPGAGALLVTFDGFVTNVGNGPLEVSGDPGRTDDRGARQRAPVNEDAVGTAAVSRVNPLRVQYETNDQHNHFHLMQAMRYSLWNLERTAEVAPAQKVGFCLYNVEPAAGAPVRGDDAYPLNGPDDTFCESDDPNSESVRMGVSAGWRDVYGAHLAFQWVDVSDTQPGTYLVASEADPDDTIWEGGEGREVNARAFSPTPVTVPGWVAQPLGAAQDGAPRALTLAATRFGAPSDAALRYRVQTAPRHGTLNVPVGAELSSPAIVYTPAPGWFGPDDFTYVAYAVDSPFPRTKQPATVSLTAATPSLTISGAPARLVAGTSAQISATLSNAPGGVAWSASAGRISATGLYRAPARPPKGGVAVIRATSAQSAALSSVARIRIVPAPRVAARPGLIANVSAGRRLLSRLAVGHRGPRVVLGKVATGRRGGRVVMTVTVKRRVLGRCVARVGPRKTVTCKVRMARPYPLAKVRMTAKFTAGRASAVRRAFVGRR